MSILTYNNHSLHLDGVNLNKIASDFSTPTYVYAKSAIIANYQAFSQALTQNNIAHKICYAVKANSNLSILHTLAQESCGFDIVSLGELKRVLTAGGNPNKIIFSGVGKTYEELKFALNTGIYCFNIESHAELYLLDALAKELSMLAPISLRVNPEVDAQSHPYISTGMAKNKFGISANEIISTYLLAQSLPNLSIKGIGCHIGSQITSVAPFLEALDKVILLLDDLKKHNITLQFVDLGGGLGIKYNDETPPTINEYITALIPKILELQKMHQVEIILEPGRAIVANAGVLLTKVIYTKSNAIKNFCIVDAGMNDLIRPALYNAWQTIVPVMDNTACDAEIYDIVGPVCESTDFLGTKRKLKAKQGSLLAILDVGAYGFSMSSNYNSRPRAAEVMIDKDSYYLIRARETIEELYALEQLLV